MAKQLDFDVGGEFSLIRQFFTQAKHWHGQVDLGVGDDAALFRVATNHQCVVSSDMLIIGQHFFANVAPYDLGHKALAVNLSDMAAMGAEPIGFTLSLALPNVDSVWLSQFSAGLLSLAQQFGCDLIGGDTTRAMQLAVNISVLGQVPVGQAIRRDGAQMGDDVWVSGNLGDAAYALALLQSDVQSDILQQIRHYLERPTPKIALGLALRGVAHSMLDISDGLAGDLRHILRASNCSAQIDLDALPLGDVVQRLPMEQAWRYALTGGDDYQLCFTAPIYLRERVRAIATQTQTTLTRIGCIQQGVEEICWHSAVAPHLSDNMQDWMGYTHF